MAMAKKATLVCRPCGTRVVVTDLGAAVVECYDCGLELQPAAKAPVKALRAKAAAKKKLPAKAWRRRPQQAAPGKK
jgi:ribosomal protein L37AE/L43A